VPERDANQLACPHCGLPGKSECWCGEHDDRKVGINPTGAERDANQLAADVRQRPINHNKGFMYGIRPAELDELVGLVGTLQQRADEEFGRAERWKTIAGEAEAQVGTLQQDAAHSWQMHGDPEKLVARAEAAEAALAEAREMVANLCTRPGTCLAATDSNTKEPAPNRHDPHEFVGRADRWCELCNCPDRHPIHRRVS